MTARQLGWLAGAALLLAGCRAVLGIDDVSPQPGGDGDGDGDAGAHGDAAAGSAGTWVKLTTDVAPPPRYEFAMAYDQGRNRIVLFGGRSGPDNSDLLGDTWEFNPNNLTWADVTPPSGSPTPRSGAGMASAFGGQVMLYGGFTDGGGTADTWTWDGAQWIAVQTTTNPSFRHNHAMFFDDDRSEVVLFGGFLGGGGGGLAEDTWIYDANDWFERSTAAIPPARELAAVARPLGGQTVLFGGNSADGALSDTWIWEGGGWTPVSPGLVPPLVECPTIARPQSSNVVIAVAEHQTYSFDGTSWSSLDTDGAPTPVQECARMVGFDDAGELLLFGGRSGSTALDDTWIFTPNP